MPEAPGAQAAELERRNRELSLVHDLALAINATLELPEILATFAKRLNDLVPFDDIEAVFPTGSWHGEVKAAWPRPPQPGEMVALTAGGNRVRACAECQVLLKGKVRWDVAPSLCCPSLAGTRYKSTVCLPLIVGGINRGLLWLRSAEPEVYGEAQRRLLELVASHLSLAVANAEALDTVRQLAKLRGDFFALATHQLRTPLTVARGYSDLLASSWADFGADERQLYLDRLARSYVMLADLVDEMLDLARIEGGVTALRLETVDLDEVLDRCVDLLQDRPDARRTVRADPPCQVLGDRFRLEQVLTNLLDNAYKYAEGPGEVAVSWQTLPHDGVRVEVASPCPDIPSGQLDALFQPFSRLERHAHLPGTGLGLRACKSLLELMGGAVGANSAGGRFRIWFELPAPATLR